MKKIKNILILAGGDSTRFWPLQKKNLLLFFDKPLVFHLIENIKDFAGKITVVLSHLNKNYFEDYRKNYNLKNIQVVIQDEKKFGMAGAVLSAKNYIDGEVLILNAEDIFDYSVLPQLINKLKSDCEYVLLAKKVESYFPGGYMAFKNGKLTAIIEKPKPEEIPSSLVRLVADYFSNINILVDGLEEVMGQRDDAYEVALSHLLKKSIKADYVLYENYCFVLKYPWHILPMMKYFLGTIKENFIDQSAQISKQAVITPPVVIEKNVKVGDFAKIVGPTYIGEGTFVADHTIVYQSHIGKNCIVGGYSEVTRSYLASGVVLHRNYVGDSVLDKKVMMGAEAATANFRFDEKTVVSMITGKKIDSGLQKFGTIIGADSKIGVGATILPGVKIGRNTFIGPGEIVDKDIGDRIFLFKGKETKNKL